jgi:2'-hydroxyisoflavone reductase
MAEILDRRIEHYTFISSVSAYAGFPGGRSYDETAPLAKGNHGYGPLKARSEEALEAAFPGRVTHLRPGLIVGPHDPTDRFTYWPRRIAQGGEVLAPGRPERPIQFIDARDLADWCVRLSEGQRTGYFNAVGPRSLLTMQRFLEACRSAVGRDARFNWVSDEELLAAGAEAWTELPLWIPENDEDSGGLFLGDNQKAIAAGLTYRPILDTIKETLEWDVREGGPPDSPIRVTTISRKREASILAGRQEKRTETRQTSKATLGLIQLDCERQEAYEYITLLSEEQMKSVLFAIVLFIFSLTAIAQEPTRPNRPSAEDMQKMMEMSMGAMAPAMAKMTEAMIEAQLKAAENPETARRIAIFKKNLYDALLKQGFSKREALSIMEATPAPSATPSMK